MEISALAIDPTWVTGGILALMRVGAFVVMFPLLGRVMPPTARLAFTFGVGLFFARPVPAVLEVGELVSLGVMNLAVGAALGWLVGLVLHSFAVAGGILDLISGLMVSQVFDPMMGQAGGVWTRMFNLVGMTLFVVLGGLGLVVAGLAASIDVLPLTGSLSISGGLGEFAISQVSRVVRAGVELALPIMGVMLMLELALGLAARFAPQANVFLLGLPAKLFAAITVVGAAWVLFPELLATIQSGFSRDVHAVLRGLTQA
ncbi:MAG: flagellar biosynthetic protein FliR [Nitriliruptoraceae bacterium]